MRTIEAVRRVIHDHIHQWQGHGGVVLMLYSLILTRNPSYVFDDLKLPSIDATLVVGDKGYCRQELVNLMLFGRATPALHDATMESLNSIYGMGVEERCQIGFLPPISARSMVGNFMKKPVYPIWVVLGGAHYTTLWSGDHSLAESKDGRLPSSSLLYHFNGLGLLHWRDDAGVAHRGARTTRLLVSPFDWKQVEAKDDPKKQPWICSVCTVKNRGGETACPTCNNGNPVSITPPTLTAIMYQPAA